MAPPRAVEEPDARGALPDEGEVHVHAVPPDVPKLPPEAVNIVERGIPLQAHTAPGGSQHVEGAHRFNGVTLSMRDLGSVDLYEPDPVAVRDDERVAVDHALDKRHLLPAGFVAAPMEPSGDCGYVGKHDEHQEQRAPLHVADATAGASNRSPTAVLRSGRSGMGPVAQPVFKTGEAA